MNSQKFFLIVGLLLSGSQVFSQMSEKQNENPQFSQWKQDETLIKKFETKIPNRHAYKAVTFITDEKGELVLRINSPDFEQLTPLVRSQKKGRYFVYKFWGTELQEVESYHVANGGVL
ncbi:MAG: hypothetical protein RIC95_13220 [Vicingaceae bacterium]